MQAALADTAAAAVSRLSAQYAAAASMAYDTSVSATDVLAVEPVGFLAHAIQAAEQAEAAHPGDDELVVAALLHDVGWLLPKPSDSALLTTDAAGAADAEFLARHDVTGARYLDELGFPPRVCALVAGHVQAKRFLCATEPAYRAGLSEGSVFTLAKQGGPMSAAEVEAWTKSRDWALMVQLRRWDEGAKEWHRKPEDMRSWESYVPVMTRVLAAAGAATATAAART